MKRLGLALVVLVVAGAVFQVVFRYEYLVVAPGHMVRIDRLTSDACLVPTLRREDSRLALC